MVKFKKVDHEDWTIFRQGTKDVISATEFDLVCDLHAKYHKHSFYKPCTCNPKTINKWIADLNVIWNNGKQLLNFLYRNLFLLIFIENLKTEQ